MRAAAAPISLAKKSWPAGKSCSAALPLSMRRSSHALYAIAQSRSQHARHFTLRNSSLFGGTPRAFSGLPHIRGGGRSVACGPRIRVARRRGRESYMSSERPLAGRNPGPMAVWQTNSSGSRCVASSRADAFSATERAALRQGGRGHGVLPLWSADLAQRRRLRRSTLFMLGRGIPQAHARGALHIFPTQC